MDDPRLWNLFYNYLDSTKWGLPTSEMGLVPDAPQEAIDAYEEFKKDEEELINIGGE